MPNITPGVGGAKEQNARRRDKIKDKKEKKPLKKIASQMSLHKSASPDGSNKSNVEPNRTGSKPFVNLHRTESIIPFNEPTSCFQDAQLDRTITFKMASAKLLGYGIEVMEYVDSLNFENVSQASLVGLRQTSEISNFCFNPLQAIRAWALLSNVAQGKTLRDIRSFINTFGCEINEINSSILALHVDIEEDIDGCVRLFTDLQKHLQPDAQIIKEASKYYGGKSERSAIQHLCFATDSDGFYSCHRINEEMRISSNGAIQYVVPEQFAPNWRSSMAIASCSDCTFYWKTLEKPQLVDNIRFIDDYQQISKTPGYLADANVGFVLPGVYQLESFYSDFALFIIQKFTKEITQKIVNYRGKKWKVEKRKVLIPKCITSIPISLFQHSNNNLSRIFCSEKSELTKLHGNLFEIDANFITLWDHYHKTNFQIVPEPPVITERIHNAELHPGKAHMCIDESSSKLFTSAQKKPDYERTLFTYYEDYLEKDRKIMETVNSNEKLFVAEKNVISFNSSFHYIMVRYDTNCDPIIVCLGRFNNTPWVRKGIGNRNGISVENQ